MHVIYKKKNQMKRLEPYFHNSMYIKFCVGGAHLRRRKTKGFHLEVPHVQFFCLFKFSR